MDLALKGAIDADLTAKVSFALNEDLPLPYRFDVVDYARIDHAPFIEHIDRHGVRFYPNQPKDAGSRN